MKNTMANLENLEEKFMDLMGRFDGDPVVKDLIEKLHERYQELETGTFTDEEYESEEFDEMRERYYSGLRESDPDEASIFQVMWFK